MLPHPAGRYRNRSTAGDRLGTGRHLIMGDRPTPCRWWQGHRGAWQSIPRNLYMNLRRWIAAGALVVAGVAGTAVKVWAMPGGGAAGPARSTGLAQEAGGRTAGASQQVLANQARAGTGGAGGVLTLSGAQWAQLRVLYAAYRHLPV